MKIVSFCIKRSYEDEYTSGFAELQKLPDFHGIAYPDKIYGRLAACRMKPKFIYDIFEEHAPFFYVDADTRILEIPEIPVNTDIGVCLNPVMAAAKESRYNKAWVYAASYFYVGRSLKAMRFVKKWYELMGDSGGDHFPFMQSIYGARDITKNLVGKIEGYHKDTYYPIIENPELAKLGQSWIA